MSRLPGPLRVLQVTDLHLRADVAGELYGVTTDASFRAVLARAMADAAWQPEVVLVTGDLAEDPEPRVYERLRAELMRLRVPVLCLPGNHDDPGLMRRALAGGNVSVCATHAAAGWRFVLLDSVLPGEPGGELASEELTRLARELAATRAWTFVSVHHQPVPVGSPWLDAVGLRNGAELLGLAARHPHLRGIAWGHVHQAFEAQQGELRLLATPSTCAQFMPGTEHCVMDTRPPAFRRLDLGPDGSIATEVRWLEELAPRARPPDSRAAS
jgi:Icc protein